MSRASHFDLRVLQPPEPHECPRDDCDGEWCVEEDLRRKEDAELDRAGSIRKGEWF